MAMQVNTVFIYKEGNEDNVEGENIIKVFSDKQSAAKYFQKRVSEHYGAPFEEVRNLLAKNAPDVNIADKNNDSDVYFGEEVVKDGDQWFLFYEEPVVTLPEDE